MSRLFDCCLDIWKQTIAEGLEEHRTAQLFGNHLVELAALALGGAPRRLAEAEWYPRGAAVRDFAGDRTAQRRSELECGRDRGMALGVTPRYVHLLLEETGRSFTHHVLERRLAKAAALLRDPLWLARKIADIAAESGFTDLSYFNRAFRRHFGAAPSDIREAARE